VFWTDAEKTIYLHEAVRTFAALSNFYRNTFDFPTVIDQHWYNVATVAGTLRSFNVTDVDLYTIIEYHFLEPPTGATWTGTLQFDIANLVDAVQGQRDQLLFETGCTLARSVQATNQHTSNGVPETVMDIRRLAWLPGSVYSNTPLFRDDVWAQESYNRNNQRTPGQPSIYKQSTQPPLSFYTDVPPAVAGNYELLTVNSGAVLTSAAPTTLIIPDDWTWAVKWGAMAELLNRESAARDPMRAKYCEQRYDQAIALMKVSPAVLYADLDYTVLDMDAVFYADTYRPGWQALPHDVPDAVYVAGLNYIALAPKPDAVDLVTLTVIENSPFPASGSAFFQFGREDADAIIGYAQHLASFKQGGAEFMATIPLLQEFIKHCAKYNDKLDTMGEFTDVIYGQSNLQEQADPRLATPDEGED
jgi:hypothetical protein